MNVGTYVHWDKSIKQFPKKWDIHEVKGGEIEYKQTVIHLMWNKYVIFSGYI